MKGHAIWTEELLSNHSIGYGAVPIGKTGLSNQGTFPGALGTSFERTISSPLGLSLRVIRENTTYLYLWKELLGTQPLLFWPSPLFTLILSLARLKKLPKCTKGA